VAYLDRIFFHELEFEVTRSSGPGGQNVNRTNSAVIMRWNVLETASFFGPQKELLIDRLSSRLTKNGELLIRSEESRDKETNRKRCFEKLEEILSQALYVQKKRKKTRPTRSSVKKRLESKTKRSNVKKSRGRIDY
jgi:ribosome-associated protein